MARLADEDRLHTYDVQKVYESPFNTNRNDVIKEIKIVQVPAD